MLMVTIIKEKMTRTISDLDKPFDSIQSLAYTALVNLKEYALGIS